MSPVPPPEFDPWFRARHPRIPVEGARGVLQLASDGATAPFIARYRGEHTRGLDEGAVREVLDAREEWDRLVARQAVILESIVRHATLSPGLRERIRTTFDADALEDLYLPYKQKKSTRAQAAREAGLDVLADWIWDCGQGTQTPEEGQTLDLWAFTFRAPEKGVPDAKTAIEGARDILVERLAEDPELRAEARRAYAAGAWLHSTKTDKARPGGRYEPYFDFHEKVSSLKAPSGAHRYLALRRGQAEGELLLSVGGSPDDPELESRLVSRFESAAVSVSDSPGTEVLRQAARIAFKGHVRTAMENEVHRALKEAAAAAAARLLAENVSRRLLEAPFGPRPVIGLDPGVRAGTRFAVLDGSGTCVTSGVVHLQTEEQRAAARRTLVALARESAVEAVAVGDGTAGRDTEIFVRSACKEAGVEAVVVLVSETGAGSYLACEAARTELAEIDEPAREAVFIGRRLQDPLRELVKIEPRSIAGRQHAHDVSPSALHRAAAEAVDSCVHRVGLDLNQASREMLARISGLDGGLGGAIIERRETHGPFRSRSQLREIPELGPKAFEQAAGFLRIPDGEHPLDATGVHPEHYAALEALAARLGASVGDLLGPGASRARQDAALEEQLGRWTRDGVVRELEAAGRDPRGPFAPFTFREDVRKLEDLKPGMVCPGLVTNVASFGAFVDVGAGHDGLVHVSQLGRGGKDPRDVIHLGERVEVRIVKVDLEKRQVSLSLKPSQAQRRPAASRRPGRPASPSGAEARPAQTRGDGKPRRKPPAPPRRRPGEKPRERRPAFNNPFAVLADLKVPKRGK